MSSTDIWWHDLINSQSSHCEPEWVSSEHPLFILYTSGSTGKPKGVQHSSGGYLLGTMLTMHWVFDYKRQRYFLVHRRRGLGHGTQLCDLWPACSGRNPGDIRRRSNLPRCRTFLEDDPGPQGDDLLHRTDSDTLAHQAGRRLAKAIRPVQPAPARLGRRADQPGSMDVVLQHRRAGALPDCGYLVADRNRLPHDRAVARRNAAQTGLLHPAAARHHGDHRQRSRRRGSGPARRLPRHQTPIPLASPHASGATRSAIKKSYFPEEMHGYYLAGDSAHRDKMAISGSWGASTTC